MDVKPLNRRMRAKCKVCNQLFVTEKRVRVRQTCSPECYTKLHESIKAEASLACAVCGTAMERVHANRQRRTCSDECRKLLISSHNNTRKDSSGVLHADPDGPLPGDPSPDQIRVMAEQIKAKNLELKRLGVITRRD